MKKFLILLFFINLLWAESIDDILKEIEIKSDLSEKTKLQNGGISFVWTRSDIERMQINKLKDVLQKLPSIEYKESSYGFPDLFTYGDNKAFVSNNVRVFINNQEIATGMYGSGFMLLGNMDLDFIDHIEIYLQNTSYEYTTEPTMILIKLYTKTAKKDNGGKIKTSYNLYDSKSVSLYYARETKSAWNCFGYFSYDENKQKKYYVDNVKVSRDYPTFHSLVSFYNENNRFLIEAISQKKDSFLDTSIDNTPSSARVDSDFLHLGYDGNFNNFYFLLDFDRKTTKSYFKDNVEPLKEYNYLYPISSQISTIDANLYNSELKYKFITDKNTLISGIKFRYKKSAYSKLYRNDVALPKTGNDTQIVRSVFLENQYSIKDNSILNIGIMKESVRNNNSYQQDDILNYRVTHTYVNNNLTFKSIFGHIEFSIDPFLVNSTGFFIKDKKIDKIKENNIAENIIAGYDKNRYEFLISYAEFKNYLVPDMFDRYLLYNSKDVVKNFNLYTSWTKEYNDIDKFLISYEYQKYNAPIIKEFKKHKIVLNNQNSFDKFDVFNEAIFIHINDEDKNYLVYNLGVRYRYSNDLILLLKGENMFNKSYKQYYMKADATTLYPVVPTQIQTIDRNIIISLEYLF